MLNSPSDCKSAFSERMVDISLVALGLDIVSEYLSEMSLSKYDRTAGLFKYELKIS